MCRCTYNAYRVPVCQKCLAQSKGLGTVRGNSKKSVINGKMLKCTAASCSGCGMVFILSPCKSSYLTKNVLETQHLDQYGFLRFVVGGFFVTLHRVFYFKNDQTVYAVFLSYTPHSSNSSVQLEGSSIKQACQRI